MADNEEKYSKLLAGLCYVIFFPINIIAILYVLLAKKGGKYAKFHALQGLCLYAIWMAISIAFSFLLALQMLDTLESTQDQFSGMSELERGIAMQKIALEPAAPMMLFSFLPILLLLGLAVMVTMGKDIQIPVLKSLINRFV